MFKFALTLFVFLAIFAIGTKAACGPDEVYRECGSPCKSTCQNPSRICIEECVRGCYCKSGFLRDVNGTCIPAGQCP